MRCSGRDRAHHQLFGLLQQAPHVWQEFATRFRQDDAPADAFEKLHSGLRLEFADLPADRTLREVEFFRRTGKIPMPCGTLECLQGYDIRDQSSARIHTILASTYPLSSLEKGHYGHI